MRRSQIFTQVILFAILFLGLSENIQAQCADIQVIELLDVPGFAQTDELVVCGKPDTLGFLIYIEEPGNISGTQMTLDFQQGMQYAGFELTHYDSTTSISVVNPDPDKPRFLLDGITNGVYVGYIGVQSTCDADINGLSYEVDIDFNYIYEDTLGNFYNCKSSVTPIRTYNSVIKTPVVNFQSVPNVVISALGTNTCRTITLSQDGISAYLEDFEFEVENLDLSQGLLLNTVKANGIDIPYNYDAANQSLITTIPGFVFPGNSNNAPSDTLFNTNERVSLEFCYQMDDCPTGPNTYPVTYYARYGCAGGECQETKIDKEIRIRPSVRPAPVATSTLSQQPGVCGDPAIIDLTLESTVPDSASGMFTDLTIGFETCEKPSLEVVRVLIGTGANQTVIPSANFTWINDDINIDFTTLTSDPDGPGVGVTDADGDGFFDDLPGGQMLNVSVELDYVCSLPPDPTSIACSQVDCSFSQFYVSANRDCGASFKVYPPVTPFNITNGATSVSSNETQATNSFFGINFGATGTSGAKTQTVEMCYVYERENVTPCPDASTTNRLQSVFAGSPAIVNDVQLVPGSISINGTSVPDSDASWTSVNESTRVLNINAGSNALGTQVCYSYDLVVDTFLCSPPVYMTGNHQVIEECDTGSCTCTTVKACESILFRSDPNSTGCSCDMRQGVSEMYRLNTGYTDATCATKVLPENVTTADRNRYLPGDTMFYETFHVFLSEESIRRDLYQLGLRTTFRAPNNRFDQNELTINPEESSIVEFSIKKSGGSVRTPIALDQIPSCIDSGPQSGAGTNIFYGSHPWGNSIETFYQPTRNCVGSGYDFYDNSYVSLFFYNQDMIEECRGITWLEDNGNCIEDWFNQYDVQIGDTLFLSQHLKVIKNPIAEANGRPKVSQLKIFGWSFLGVIDPNVSTNCYSGRGVCREDRIVETYCPTDVSATSNIAFDDCGGTASHTFTVDNTTPIGWFANEFRPYFQLKDIDIPIFSPLMYCGNATASNPSGKAIPLSIQDTTNFACLDYQGDTYCPVSNGTNGTITFNPQKDGYLGLGVGLGGSFKDSLTISYDLCMVCPADLSGISNFELTYDYQHPYNPPSPTCYICNFTAATGANNELDSCLIYGNGANYYNAQNLDNMVFKDDNASSDLFLTDNRSGFPPLSATVSQSLISSVTPGTSVETVEYEICATDLMDPTLAVHQGVLGSIVIPSSVAMFDILDGTNVSMNIDTIGSNGQTTTYSFQLPDLNQGDCVQFKVLTTLLFCPEAPLPPPEMCATVTSGCMDQDLQALVAGNTEACNGTSRCHAYTFGEAGIQADFVLPGGTQTFDLCAPIPVVVLVKNVKIATVTDFILEWDIPTNGAAIVPGSFEVSYPNSGDLSLPFTSIPDPVINGSNLIYTDDSIFSGDIDMNGLPGVNISADSNQFVIRFDLYTDCDEFVSGSQTLFEATASDPCTPERLSSGTVNSNGIIINEANPADFAQILTTAKPSDAFCGAESTLFTLTGLNISEVGSGDSVQICLTFPEELIYETGSLQYNIPAAYSTGAIVESMVGTKTQICFDGVSNLPVGGQFTISYKGEMTTAATCEGIRIGVDVKEYIENVNCVNGAACDVWVQSSVNNDFGVDLNPPIEVLDLTLNSQCTNFGDTIVMCYEATLYNPGPSYTGDVSVTLHDDITGNSILDYYDSALGTDLYPALTLASMDTIIVTKCFSVDEPNACPVIINLEYETSCACTNKAYPFDEIKPQFLADLPPTSVLCPGEEIAIEVCGNYTFTVDPISDGYQRVVGDSIFFGLNNPGALVTITASGSIGDCSSTDILFMRELEVFPVVLEDTIACVNQDKFLQLVIPSEFSDAVDISWSPTTNIDDPTIANPIFTPPADGAYIYTISYDFGGGCIIQDDVTIFVETTNMIGLIGDTEFCAGYAPANLTADAGFDFYEWYKLDGGFEIIKAVTTTNTWSGPFEQGTFIVKGYLSTANCPSVSNPWTVNPIDCIDLELDKTICDFPINPGLGDTISFCIEVCNIGDPAIGLVHDANNIEVEDSWPPGVSYIDYTSNTGTFIYGAPLGTWLIPQIASGTCESLEIRATILSEGVIENVAQVTSYGGVTDVDSDANNDNGNQSEDEEDKASIEVILANIGDLLFIDANADGIQDAGETGVAGATVILYDAVTGLPIEMVVTDVNGNYLFEDYPSGNYYVEFDLSTATTPGAMDYYFTIPSAGNGSNDSEVNAAGLTPTFTFDATLGDDLTHDAGVIPVADLGNFVWVDADGDGVQDTGEAGVDNVQVTLLDATTGTTIATVFTDPSGMYLFENLPAGNYEIVFDYSTATGTQDYVFSPRNTGLSNSDSNVDALGSTGAISFDPLSGDDLTIDAGLVPVADIGNYVWIDSDRNGIQDTAESGIENVEVTLYDFNTGVALFTVLTDNMGMYLFENIPDGDYYIEFDPTTSTLGNDYSFTNQNTGNGSNDSDADTNGTTGLIDFDPTMGDDLTIDAGVFPSANIGDFVWVDTDGNGVIDPSETGVAGATVTLYDAITGAVIATTTTNANGMYLFIDIPSGNYEITYDVSTATTPGVSNYIFTQGGMDSEANAMGQGPSFIFDATTGDDLDHDAGIVPSANIGNYVWVDLDGDGIQDGIEQGVQNVMVTLFDNVTGMIIGTTMTDANGMYLFEDILVGNYEIIFDYSTATGIQDYVFSPQNTSSTNTDSNVDAAGSTGVFSFDPVAGNDLTIDAGLVPVADIGNYVWIDSDRNGIQDTAESGIENVEVTLYDFNTGVALFTVLTDNMGMYLFENIPDGDYYIEFDPTTSTLGNAYSFTNQNTGNGSDDSDAAANGFTGLIDFDPTMGDDLTIDAGVFPSANIGDFVWVDTDGNGVIDPSETGVAGATVTLYDAITGAVIATTTTDANGMYLFIDIPSGNYEITYDVSTATTPGVSNYIFTQGGMDSEANAMGQGPFFTFDATMGDDLDHDAGIVPSANIGNYVWVDLDGDGIQDGAEQGVQNVMVTLFDNVTGMIIGTTMTDANGMYLFEDILVGNYEIIFDYSTTTGIQDYVFSPQNTSSTNTDSNVDAAGSTGVFSFDPVAGNDLTIDAGLVPVADIGNYVWIDSDRNGIQDTAESGIENVEVTLYDFNTGVALFTVLTDNMGMYLFENIPDGDYYIEFDPATSTLGNNYSFTNQNTGNGSDDSDAAANGFTGLIDFDPTMGDNLTIDAGIFPSANIGDFVWVDTDGNGVIDPSETGVAGATVTLYDAITGAVIAMTTTDANGMYLFKDIPSGDYEITYDVSTANTPGVSNYIFTQSGLDSEANANGAGPAFSFDASLGDDLDHDAGIVPSANIGNYVWIDSDADGIQDAAEQGVPNVLVTLYDDATGLAIATTSTDANGMYLFEDITSGNYHVEFDATGAGVGMLEYTSAGTGNGTNDSEADANGVSPGFLFDPISGDDLSHDAGIILVEGIGNFVWIDTDGDGIQDMGEPGLEGVTVTLYDGNTGQVIGTAITDANGEYLFPSVPAGNYYIGFDISTNTSGVDYPFVAQNAGTGSNDSDADANGFTTAFNFDPTMGPDLSWDAGIVPSADIGDTVWVDTNGDGVLDPSEIGVAGATVTLFDAITGAVIATTATDANGNYVFEDMPSGDYQISYDISTATTPGLSDYIFTQGGMDSEADANGTGPIFSFDAALGDDLDHDAGIVPSANIGDYVWIDSDGDGIQDFIEQGIQNISVTLYDDATGMAIATVLTDANGMYLFEDIVAGDYHIEFDATVAGIGMLQFTSSGSGNGANDSEADANGVTPGFTFDPTLGDDLTHDAGIFPVESIGDFVWIDNDGDGIQDAGEVGVEGVTVTLYDANTGQSIGTVTTDANGEYMFTNVPAGDYYIGFDITTNTTGIDYPFTQSNAGSGTNDSDADPSGFTTAFTFDPTMGPDLTWDAGIVPSANIGDTVWIDNDGGGVQDPTEMGVAGVTVTLFNAITGLPIGTVITDANGNYLFEDIPSGDYYITYDLSTSTTPGAANYPFTQSGMDSEADANGQSPSFSFDATMGDDLDHDAGIVPSADIGNLVWEDTDEDGIKDFNESGVSNVTVELYDNNNMLIATVLTDSNGEYLFEDIPAGEYYVVFNLAGSSQANSLFTMMDAGTNDVNDSDADANGQTPNFVFDPSTGDDLTIDAGIIPVNNIGDFVWIDSNGDGIQDVGEMGVVGVTVTLYDANTGAVIGTVLTDANGMYLFEDMPKGDYYINFDLSTNTSGVDYPFTESGTGNGVNDSDADANGNTVTFTFDPKAGPDLTWDAGIIPSANIGDTVWIDSNGDGVQDPTEAGVEGVTVTLFDAVTGLPIATVITDANGNYLFEDLPSGDYYITYDPSTSTTPGAMDYPFTMSGMDSEANANGQGPSFSFDATMGDDLDHDAGLNPVANIGNYVWIDTDGDGIQDFNESGIENVMVILYDMNGMPLDTVFTDASGEYVFENVPAGEYSIGFDFTTSNTGDYEFSPMGNGDGTNDSEANAAGQTPNFVFDPSTGDDLTHDAGLIPVAQIGDFVWIDTNGDGIQDIGEAGVAGVTVTLYDANTGAVVATVMTDANGMYAFDDVPMGDYYINFDISTNTSGVDYPFTDSNTGNGTNDSDADANGNTVSFSFDPANGADLTWDAGIIPSANIGDTVWIDSNGDGVQDPTEVGVEGVTVTLYDAVTGLPIATVLTDANGNYLFEDLPSGDYYITYDPSTSTTPGVADYPFSPSGMDSEADSNGQGPSFSFDATMGDDLDHDAGLHPVANIGDYVWVDTDGDGIQDASEMGLENVMVILYDNNGMPLDTVFTDVNGQYVFVDVPAGEYSIGFDYTTSNSGDFEYSPMGNGNGTNGSAADANGQIPNFIFDPSMGDDLVYDAGLIPVADLGDTVFIDADGDGIQDSNEMGLAGVTVNLYDANTGIIIASVMTDANGNYLFEDLPVGDYYIGFDASTSPDLAGDYDFSPTGNGNGATDSDAGPDGFTSVVNFDPTMGDDLTIDAGIIPTSSIGDFVWVDTDGDGIQDPGETGVEGVTVTLYDAITGLPVGTVVTDADGNYLFEDVPSGDYYIEFDVTTSEYGEDFTFATQNSGTPGEDSDADGNGTTPVFTFDASQGDLLTIDAGIQPTPMISNVKYIVSNTINANGDLEVVFGIGVKNTGVVDLTNLSLQDDLATQLGAGFMNVIGTTLIVNSSAASNPILNTNYNGSSDIDLFIGSSADLLQPGQEIVLEITVIIDPVLADFPLQNQTITAGDGLDKNGAALMDGFGNAVRVSDISDSGRMHQDDNPGEPGDTGTSDDPTLIECFPANIIVTGDEEPLCYGQSATLDATSDYTNVQYQWREEGSTTILSTSTTPSFAPLVTTNYEVTLVVFDDICVYDLVDTITINVLNEIDLTIDVTYTPNSDCSPSDLSFEAFNNGNPDAFSEYDWTGPNGFESTDPIPVIMNAGPEYNGSYTLIAATVSGCVVSRTIQVSQIPTSTVNDPIITSSGPACEGGAITLSTAIQTGININYNWTMPNTTNVVGQGTNEITIFPLDETINVGDYSVTVSIDGCSLSSDVFAVTALSAASALPTATSTSICEGDDLFLEANSPTGVTFAWSGPLGFTSDQRNPEVTNVSEANNGTYTLVVSNAEGCTNVSEVDVTNILAPAEMPTISVNGPSCEGEDIILTTSSSGTTFEWIGPLGASQSTLMMPALTTSNPSTNIDANNASYLSGDWSVQVTDANGCTAISAPINITINEVPEAIIINNGDVCEGQMVSLSATIVADGTYQWFDADPNAGGVLISQEQTIQFFDLASGTHTYYMQVTANGCVSMVAMTSVIVHQLPTTDPSFTYMSNVDCAAADLSLVANAIGAAPITFSWTGPNGFTSTDENPTIPGAAAQNNGSYTLQTIDANGCQSELMSIQVEGVENIVSLPVITSSGPACEGESIYLSIPAYTGSQVSYMWTTPNGFTNMTGQTSNVLIISPVKDAIHTGDYSVQVLVDGCTVTSDPFAVTIFDSPSANITIAAGSICTANELALFSNATNAASYSWTGPNGFTSNAADVVIPNVDIANNGTYTVVLTSQSGCSITAAIVVDNISEEGITPTLLMPTDICVGQDLILSTTAIGVQYEWISPLGDSPTGVAALTTNTNTTTITAASAAYLSGNWTLRVTDADDCVATSFPVSLSINETPTALARNNGPICEKSGDIILIGNEIPDATYEWYLGDPNNGGNLFSTDMSPTLFSPKADTTDYYLVVTQNGCSSEPSLTQVEVSAKPIANPTAVYNLSPDCALEDLQLEANAQGTAPFQFLWSGPNAFTSTEENPSIMNITEEGNGSYTLVLTDANGCESTSTVELNDISNPQPQPVISTDGISCDGGAIVLYTQAYSGSSVSYVWTTPNGTTQDISGLATNEITISPVDVDIHDGDYILTVMVDDCTLSSAPYNLEVLAEPIAAVPTAVNTGVCVGEDILLQSEVAADYFWSGPNGFISALQFPVVENASLGSEGTYFLTVFNEQGCESNPVSIDITIDVKPATPTIVTSDNVICDTEDIVLNTSSICDEYQWIGPGGSSVGTLANPLLTTISNTTSIPSSDEAYAQGMWSLICINGNGCASEESEALMVTIIDIQEPRPTADQLVACASEVVNLSAGEGYDTGTQFFWYDADPTTSAANLLSNLQNPSLIEQINSGSYTYWLQIEQAGCMSAPAPVTVIVAEGLQIAATNDGTECISATNDVNLNAQVFNGTPPFSYNWTGPNGFQSIAQNAELPNAANGYSGVYILNVSDANGCSAVTETVVDVTLLPAEPILAYNTHLCLGAEFVITAPLYDGEDVHYYWTGPNGSTVDGTYPDGHEIVISEINQSDNGDYTLYVDVDGCTSAVSASVPVFVNDLPVVAPINNGSLCSGIENDLNLVANATGGQGPFTYFWQGPNGYTSQSESPQISNLGAEASGTYTVYVVDANGCQSSIQSTNVNVSELPDTPVLELSTSQICENEQIVLTTQLYNTTDVTYTWILADGSTIETAVPTLLVEQTSVDLYDGLLSVMVTVDGCTSNQAAPMLMQVSATPDAPSIANTTTSSNPVCEGESVLFSSPLNTDAVYYWTGPNGFTSNLPTPAISNASLADTGLYTLVIEIDGCFSSAVQTEVYIVALPDIPVASNQGPYCEDMDIELRVLNPDPEALYKWYRQVDDFEVGSGVVLILPAASQVNAGGYYVTAQTEDCVSESSNTTVVEISAESSSIANAGEDEIVCSPNYTIGSPTIEELIGYWTAVAPNGQTTIIDPEQSQTLVTNLVFGDNQFVWTVSSGACENLSTDTLTITYNDAPIATDDVYTIDANEELVSNVLDNDSANAQDYTIGEISQPENGVLVQNNDGTFSYTPNSFFIGTDSYTYELCHLYCPENCVEATVFINIGQQTDCFAPSIITPNEDGVNDSFTVPCLSNFENSSICIFNRWGDELFTSDDYQNDWDGTYRQDNKNVPNGTYFYILKINDGLDTVITGYVFVQR